MSVSMFKLITKINVICSDHTIFLSVLPDQEGFLSINIITDDDDDLKLKLPFLKNSIENKNYKKWNKWI